MQNHKEVVEEDKRNKLPANWESRKRQAEWIIQDEAARKDAEAKVIQQILIKSYTYIYLDIQILIYTFYRAKITNEKNC